MSAAAQLAVRLPATTEDAEKETVNVAADNSEC
jgi:hypothetical protein